MKLREADVDVEYSDDAEVIEMTISKSGLPKLFVMLSGMYNDPALAVIREYTTNAIDAHIEAGVDRPVDVYLPSELGEPQFIVRDYGIGMGKQEVYDTFSQYVESTKDTSDDFAGMFGIGSKSAFSYTSKWTAESVKDGILTTMSLTKTALAPEIEIRQSKTNRPSGTTVKIPVSNMNSFNGKARSHYALLAGGLVHVNGKDIGGQFRETDLGNGVYASENLEKSYVVMGNVPYELPEDVNQKYDRYGYRTNSRSTRAKFLFEVPIGEFMPAPPREGLELNDDDLKRIKKMLEDADKAYVKKLTDAVRNAKTVFDAVAAYQKLSSKVYNNALGEVTVDGHKISGYKLDVPDMVWDSDKTADSTYNKCTVRTNMFGNKRYTFFFNAEDDISDYYRKKITDWCQHQGEPTEWVGVKKKSQVPSGYPDELIFDFAKVQDWSRPSISKSSGTTSGLWQKITKLPYHENWQKSRTPFTWNNTENVKVGAHKKDGLDLVYVSPSDYDEGVTIGMLQMAIQSDDVLLISLGKNRWDKLNRNFKAEHIKPWYKAKKDKLIKGISEDAFRRPSRKLPDLDSDLHRRYNERADELSELRKKAIDKLGSSQVKSMTTGSDPELIELRKKIEERYPYAPDSLYYGRDKEKANVYIAAMDLYYKENDNE